MAGGRSIPRRLQTPLATFALFVFVILNARSQPNGRGRGWTVVGHLATSDHHYWEAPPCVVLGQRHPIAWVVRDAGGLRLAPLSECREMSTSSGLVSLEITRRRSGFWSVTRDVSRAWFDVHWAGDFTRAEQEHLRTLAAAHVRVVDGGVSAWQAPLFERGDTTVDRTVWAGWLNNVVVVVAGAALFWTLGWVPRVVRAYLVWRAELERWKAFQRADRMRGRCVMCGYDTRGLPGPRCPECGSFAARVGGDAQVLG